MPRLRRAAPFAVLALLALLVAVPATAQDSGTKGAGTEDRQWVTSPAAPPASTRYPVVVEDDVWVEMRDGVRLEARLYLPSRPDGPGPCVLTADGYGKDSGTGRIFIPILSDLASRGYAAAHVSLRGSGNSEGEANLYNRFGQDGYDLVEWMAAQDWCDGNVGMTGLSLLGISQWLTARQAPPSLKAIIPAVACGDCYDYLWYPGGMLPGPGRRARGEPEYPSALAHRDFDDWWRERTTLAEDHAAIAGRGVAALITGGWPDYLSPANMQAFEEFTAAGGEAKLIVGPWAHIDALAHPGLQPRPFLDYQQLWFDRFLAGLDSGVDAEPRVLIYVQGPDEWRFEDAFPLPDERRARLHLSAEESGSIASLNDGSLTWPPPGAAPTVGFDYTPESGPFLPTMLDTIEGRDNSDMSEHEARTLTWTTAPLDASTEVTGWPEVSLWASATAEDTDFVVQISDVAPDGTSRQVTVGYLNAPRAASRAEPRPVTPGAVVQYHIKVWPTSYVFPAGHRIRLSLAGASMPGEGQESPQGPAPNPNAATVTVFQDAEHPSYLELPVIGTAVLPGEVVVERVAGAARFDTAAAASRRSLRSADAVVLARGDDYADGLAAGPLAAALGAPVLLTERDRLTAATEVEITRLGASEAVLLGGPGAIGPSVQERLEEMGLAVRRVAGANRFATAATAAHELHGDVPVVDDLEVAFVVEGAHADPARGWPDAVSAAPYASVRGAPVLLVTHDRLPEETAAALADLDVDEVVVVGGPGAVSDAVVEQLRDAGHATRRLSGATRYETSAAVYEEAREHGVSPSTVWLATGRDWPDALAAAPVVAARAHAFLLIDGHDLDASPPTRGVLIADRVGIDRAVLLGGAGAITAQTEAQVGAILAEAQS